MRRLIDALLSRWYVPRQRWESALDLLAAQKRAMDEMRKPWTHVVYVADEIAEQLRCEWSKPVQIRIATRKQGFYLDELELVMRYVDRVEYPGITVTTDFSKGLPCS